jgi:hypothetical protein
MKLQGRPTVTVVWPGKGRHGDPRSSRHCARRDRARRAAACQRSPCVTERCETGNADRNRYSGRAMATVSRP